MTTIAKTIVATGVSSGVGFEAIKQLLAQPQPYKVIFGARDTAGAQKAYDALEYDRTEQSVSILPLELSELQTVKTFAQQTLEKLGQDKIDYLFLNAATTQHPEPASASGPKFVMSYIANHLSQHYLIHLLKDKLTASRSRIVVTSSGGVRGIEPTDLEKDLQVGSSVTGLNLYARTKFVQLLATHWWRGQLQDSCRVIATSPGLILGTGLARGAGIQVPDHLPDAKTVPEGGSNLVRAFVINDFPEDPEQIFLTSWGEWWPKDVYAPTLDKVLQDKWSPSREEIELEAGIVA